ncbi:MAG: hypothetical protein CVU84_00605 [Firmicutes bacterium HGW-Firmicutes-1]|jgi:YesN/AraC family two-component response regulator|nr:MAG: hypothetical protein CVU84_00605 [Firmicutes bacterium HGW-Firmicutes-1]
MNELTLSISEKMNLFYQFTQVPIHLFSDDEHIFSYTQPSVDFQKHFNWFYEIVHDSLKNQVLENLLYLSNDLEEAFLITILQIHDKNHYILCGPYVLAQSHEEFINKLILKRKVSLEDKDELIHYFSFTSLVDEKRNIYYRQLFCELFVNLSSNSSGKENSLSEKFYLHRIENKEKWYSHPPYFIEQSLLVKIKEGNVEESEKIVQSLNTYHDATLSTNSIRSFKNSLICRCTLYTRAVIEGGVDSESAFTLSDTYINEIEHRSDIQDLYHLDIKMIREFVKLINTKINRMYSPLVQSTIKIISTSLNDKISVKEIAEQIPANANYLSQVFKKEVGTALSVYINQIKIEEAKYFLSFTNSSLADISSFFHFASQSHFASVFKKHAKMTPLEYRKNYKNSRNTLQ